MARVMVQLARQARGAMTSAETLLWGLLRDRRLAGRKFRRQAVIGRYRPDFYCVEEKLVIELDGEIHNTPEAQAKDLERTQWLESQGLKVIRFRNQDLFEHTPLVLKTIQSHFRSPHPPTLLP